MNFKSAPSHIVVRVLGRNVFLFMFVYFYATLTKPAQIAYIQQLGFYFYLHCTCFYSIYTIVIHNFINCLFYFFLSRYYNYFLLFCFFFLFLCYSCYFQM